MVADIVNDPEKDSTVLKSDESNSVNEQQPLYTELLTQDCTNYMAKDFVNDHVNDSNVLYSHESHSVDEQLKQLQQPLNTELQSSNDSVAVNPQSAYKQPLYTALQTPICTNYMSADIVNEPLHDSNVLNSHESYSVDSNRKAVKSNRYTRLCKILHLKKVS